ncbi:MAG: single-stranded-DNA-specific exonuclease RecJ, partial [Alphaproteobacteria bacterium]|nr:single-stranded-DNA-specific exonuclease RecJ [Alphaproteobacteria bacterium]
IDSSLNKARWVIPETSLNDVDLIMRNYELPEIIARILCQRGIPLKNVPSFLNPTLKDDFPDPFSLKTIGDMAEDVAKAIEEKQSFAIFGDFDVDGATSSAVLYRFLKALGIEASIYIPDRLKEGYGPNIDALKSIKEQGADILMMLDCGTTAFDIVKAGTDLGLKIIIIDHHETEESLPECWYVINPKRKDDNSGLDMLAAVGVTFMACVAINNRLRDRNYYRRNKIKEPNLKALLDIVALGTVCDMVPLTKANRLFVRMGLNTIETCMNVGMRELVKVSGISAPLSTYDCGFVLGPRINAGSRVHEADLGAKLLSYDEPETCNTIAWTLNDCNDKRKAIQQQMESEAIAMVEELGLEKEALILVAHEDWHPGLSGLVAGRLKEKYNKPTCVVTYAYNLSGDKEGRGSGRSIPGIHIAQSFIDARVAGLLEKGGGHAMAGGFTVQTDKIDTLRQFLNDHIMRQMQNTDMNVETIIDGVLTLSGVNVDLVQMLNDKIGPFGQEQPEPVFMFKDVCISKADILGGSHIRVMLKDWEGGGWLKSMAFRSVGTSLGDALLQDGNNARRFHILGQIKINEWQGRKTAELHIKDVAPAS